MSATDAADTRKGIQSVEVSGVIIAALCDFKFPVPLKDLAAAVDMSPAKVHRYLASLVRIGLAWQDDQTGLYGLGPMALRMGISAIERNDVVMRAGRLLRKLAIELRSSGHLAIWGERSDPHRTWWSTDHIDHGVGNGHAAFALGHRAGLFVGHAQKCHRTCHSRRTRHPALG